MEMTPVPPVKKRSNVWSWLGFGLSLAMLLIVWFAIIYIFSHKEEIMPEGVQIVVLGTMISLFTIGALGIFFSIIGLVIAYKHSQPKWMAVCGIIFSCLIIPSIFGALLRASQKTETLKIELPTTNDTSEQITADTVAESDCKVFLAVGYSDIKCYDNRNGKDKLPAKISSFDDKSSKKKQIQTWLKVKNIGSDEVVGVCISKNAKWDDLCELLDIVSEINIKQYQLVDQWPE